MKTKQDINEHKQIKSQIATLKRVLSNSQYSTEFAKKMQDAIDALEKLLPYF